VAGQPLQADIYDRVTNVCCGDVGRTRFRLVLAQTLSTHPFGELCIGKSFDDETKWIPTPPFVAAVLLTTTIRSWFCGTRTWKNIGSGSGKFPEKPASPSQLVASPLAGS